MIFVFRFTWLQLIGLSKEVETLRHTLFQIGEDDEIDQGVFLSNKCTYAYVSLSSLPFSVPLLFFVPLNAPFSKDSLSATKNNISLGTLCDLDSKEKPILG